jgi:hypothetical protein
MNPNERTSTNPDGVMASDPLSGIDRYEWETDGMGLGPQGPWVRLADVREHLASGVTVDRGPWSVAMVDGKPELFSDDFEHDVKLRISGDFADDQQRMNYANALAAQLNAASGVRVSDHEPNGPQSPLEQKEGPA